MSSKQERSVVHAITFVALLLLTAVSYGLSQIGLGPYGTPLGVAIGGIEAMLVALFFMHMVRADTSTVLTVLTAILWLGILVGLVVVDVGARPL